jgi:hypothetical protein
VKRSVKIVYNADAQPERQLHSNSVHEKQMGMCFDLSMATSTYELDECNAVLAQLHRFEQVSKQGADGQCFMATLAPLQG